MPILQEIRTYAEGVLQKDQRKRSPDHSTGQTVQGQRSNLGEECGRHHSLRLSGFTLCADRTVVPSTVPDISDIHTTPQLINNIRNDVADVANTTVSAVKSIGWVIVPTV